MKIYKIQTRIMLVAFISIISLIGFSAAAQTVSSHTSVSSNYTITSYLLSYNNDFRISVITGQASGKVKVLVSNNPNHEKVEISISRNGLNLNTEFTNKEKAFAFDMTENPEGTYLLSIKAQGKEVRYQLTTDVQTFSFTNISPFIPLKGTLVVIKK